MHAVARLLLRTPGCSRNYFTSRIGFTGLFSQQQHNGFATTTKDTSKSSKSKLKSKATTATKKQKSSSASAKLSTATQMTDTAAAAAAAAADTETSVARVEESESEQQQQIAELERLKRLADEVDFRIEPVVKLLEFYDTNQSQTRFLPSELPSDIVQSVRDAVNTMIQSTQNSAETDRDTAVKKLLASIQIVDQQLSKANKRLDAFLASEPAANKSVEERLRLLLEAAKALFESNSALAVAKVNAVSNNGIVINDDSAEATESSSEVTETTEDKPLVDTDSAAEAYKKVLTAWQRLGTDAFIGDETLTANLMIRITRSLVKHISSEQQKIKRTKATKAQMSQSKHLLQQMTEEALHYAKLAVAHCDSLIKQQHNDSLMVSLLLMKSSALEAVGSVYGTAAQRWSDAEPYYAQAFSLRTVTLRLAHESDNIAAAAAAKHFIVYEGFNGLVSLRFETTLQYAACISNLIEQEQLALSLLEKHQQEKQQQQQQQQSEDSTSAALKHIESKRAAIDSQLTKMKSLVDSVCTDLLALFTASNNAAAADQSDAAIAAGYAAARSEFELRKFAATLRSQKAYSIVALIADFQLSLLKRFEVGFSDVHAASLLMYAAIAYRDVRQWDRAIRTYEQCRVKLVALANQQPDVYQGVLGSLYLDIAMVLEDRLSERQQQQRSSDLSAAASSDSSKSDAVTTATPKEYENVEKFYRHAIQMLTKAQSPLAYCAMFGYIVLSRMKLQQPPEKTAQFEKLLPPALRQLLSHPSAARIRLSMAVED